MSVFLKARERSLFLPLHLLISLVPGAIFFWPLWRCTTQPDECLLCAASYGPRAGEEARAFATSQTSPRLVYLPLGGLAGLWDGVPRLSHSCRSSKPHVTGKRADTSLLWQMWTQPPEALQCEGTAGAGAALATPAARPSWALLGPAHAGTAGRAQQGAKRQHGDSREMNNSLPDTLHLFLEGPHARKPRGLVFSPPWLGEPAGCSISKPSSHPKGHRVESQQPPFHQED